MWCYGGCTTFTLQKGDELLPSVVVEVGSMDVATELHDIVPN